MIEQEMDRFLEALAYIRAPILEWRRPGLSRSELNAALAELGWPAGLAVPSEAYAWWGWQNGTIDRTDADDYNRSTAPVISPAGLILRPMEALIAKWTASWISMDARPPVPYVPLGADGSEAGLFGLRPYPDGIWRMNSYVIDYGQWQPIPTQHAEAAPVDAPSPTLAEYLSVLTDRIHVGHVGVALTGGIYVLDDSEEGLGEDFPWLLDHM